MAGVQKYAQLPDLDAAPDIYETPELTDDGSTHPTTLRSDSQASSYQDVGEEGRNGIDRHRLDPDEARTHFLPSRVDARNVDFSDRISSKRKSYQVSSRRRKKDGPGNTEDEEDSEGEEETLERKLARLRREVTEARSELDRRRKKDQSKEDLEPEAGDSLDTLSRVLEDIKFPDAAASGSAAARLIKGIQTNAITKSSIPTPSSETESSQNPNTYTITYAPNYHQTHTLSKVADFDTRLTFLESILGVDTIPLPTQDRPLTKAILPTLDNLDRQLETLSSSASSLDRITRRVQQLTIDTNKLTEARKTAKAAQEALSPPRRGTSSMDAVTSESKHVQIDTSPGDPEQISKINALYGTLTTIESLSPLLPSVLDRLRSLRAIHADAATASQTLMLVESKQADMAEEIRSWREGLERMEGMVRRGEESMKGNAEVVEGWVRELEGRMERLGS